MESTVRDVALIFEGGGMWKSCCGRGCRGHVGERAVLRRRVRTLRGRAERDRLPVARRAAGGGVVRRIARRPGVPLVDRAVRGRGRRARGPARPRARTSRVRASVRLRGVPGEPGAARRCRPSTATAGATAFFARADFPDRAGAHGARAGLHELPGRPAAHLGRTGTGAATTAASASGAASWCRARMADGLRRFFVVRTRPRGFRRRGRRQQALRRVLLAASRGCARRWSTWSAALQRRARPAGAPGGGGPRLRVLRRTDQGVEPTRSATGRGSRRSSGAAARRPRRKPPAWERFLGEVSTPRTARKVERPRAFCGFIRTRTNEGTGEGGEGMGRINMRRAFRSRTAAVPSYATLAAWEPARCSGFWAPTARERRRAWSACWACASPTQARCASWAWTRSASGAGCSSG